MVNKFLKWLKSPYPLLYGNRRDYLQIIITSIFISALLYAIQPFGLANLSERALILFVIKMTTGAMFASILVTQILPRYSFNEDQWLIWKQAALTLLNFLVVALVLQYLVLKDISILILFSYLAITMLLASGPLLMRLLITQNRLLKENLEQAKMANVAMETSEAKAPLGKQYGEKTLTGQDILDIQDTLNIKTNDGELLSFTPQQFIYAKAEKNYVEIFLQDADKVKNIVLRMAFSSLVQQLNESPIPLIHCHRSYLVNQKSVNKIIGNSRGYSLQLSVEDVVVPVSRAKAKYVLSDLKNLDNR